MHIHSTCPTFVQVTLREFGHFEHGRSCTLWLRPQAEGGQAAALSWADLLLGSRHASTLVLISIIIAHAQYYYLLISLLAPPHHLQAELLAVQAALERAFPQCRDLSNDTGRGIAGFTPHLSLGQWCTPAEVTAAAARLAADWRPITFQAGGVAFLDREGFDDPFTLRYYVPFGGGQPVAARVPYVATVGDASSLTGSGALSGSRRRRSSSSPLAASLFGIGAARGDGTVWQFAYGANMAPSKLNGSHGLHPLESLPARLPGWRLGFTHRGGMGNLVPLAAGQAGPAGLGAVHGVLHRLSPADYGRLANMEHEYE